MDADDFVSESYIEQLVNDANENDVDTVIGGYTRVFTSSTQIVNNIYF